MENIRTEGQNAVSLANWKKKVLISHCNKFVLFFNENKWDRKMFFFSPRIGPYARKMSRVADFSPYDL